MQSVVRVDLNRPQRLRRNWPDFPMTFLTTLLDSAELDYELLRMAG